MDALGRLWIGTKDVNLVDKVAKLYLYDTETLIPKISDVTISNGIDWSLDNKTFYFTDTPAQEISQYDFDLKNGEISNPRTFAKVSPGMPDGLTMDSEGNIFGAHWDGGCVTVYSPKGQVIEVICLPCQNVTSVAFGGKNYKTLFATSAYYGLGEDKTLDDGIGVILKEGKKYQGRAPFLMKL